MKFQYADSSEPEQDHNQWVEELEKGEGRIAKIFNILVMEGDFALTYLQKTGTILYRSKMGQRRDKRDFDECIDNK